MNNPVHVEIRRTALLDGMDRTAMEALYRAYFTGAEQDAFSHDLGEKDFVILLRSPSGVCGFSTMKLLEISGISVLFSGDTIVDESSRFQTGLAGAFGHVMKMLEHDFSDRKFFWFLISKGARTYRFLPTFFRRYVPGQSDEPELLSMLRTVASGMFPSQFNTESGILHFSGKKDRLINDSLRTDRHSVFFRQRNPGWFQGDELCCMAPLAMDNLNALGRRVIESVAPTWIL